MTKKFTKKLDALTFRNVDQVSLMFDIIIRQVMITVHAGSMFSQVPILQIYIIYGIAHGIF
jgi:hypothetical protein